MQKKEELNPKSMASSHSQTLYNNTKVREEGELSSSDDDALLTGSAAPLPSTSVQHASSPIQTSLQGVNSGKLSSGMISGGSTHNQSRTPHVKSFSANKAPLKSTNSRWCAPAGDGNLVISFSDDDDSGSDVEERREKVSACDRPQYVLSSSKRPPSLPHVKMQTVSKTTRKVGKVMPKKVSSSRTFVSKIHEPSGKSGVPALAEQKAWLKNPSVTEKSAASQDPVSSKNLDMSSSKLEDLRQQIAVRESELKLKLVQQNRKNVSEIGRDVNSTSQRKVPSRKCKSIPADALTQPKEPDRKRLRTDAPVVNVSCSLSDWMSLPKQTAMSTGPIERSMSKQPGDASKNQPSRSAPNQDINESNMNVNDHYDATSSLKSTSDSILQACALPVSTSKFESPDVSPDNTSLFLHLGKSRDLRSREADLQSLFEFEELHDKELEEAQEHRQKCEVEERNALNAYRRAQRALLEANARCSYLYRKRELYSTQLHSFLMEDTSMLYSPRHSHETEERWNLTNNVSEVNLDIIPSSHQLEDFEAGNRLGYDSNVQSADGDAHNRSSVNEDGHNLGSEACSEPDTSTSELVRGNRLSANGRNTSPSGDLNLSPDDDYENFSLDNRSADDNVRCPRSKDNTKESVKDVDSVTNFSTVGSQDPLFLEEYLRSKLISRLGSSSVKCSGIGDNSELSMPRAAEEGVACTQPQMKLQSVSLCDRIISAPDCQDVAKEPEGSTSKPLLNPQNQLAEEHCLNESPVISYNPQECRSLSVEIASKSTVLLSSVFRSAIKALGPVTLDNMQIKEQQYGFLDRCTKDNLPSKHTQENLCLEMISSAERLVRCAGFGKIDSYTCKTAIDPFWPLCMYELQGRCNNDECPWQHLKDYSGRDDCQSGWAAKHQNLMYQREPTVLTPPRYLVYLDNLKDESHAHGSLKARYFGSYGKNIFSCSLAVSSSIIKHLPSNEPCLHGNDGCVESDGGSGYSLYFQSRNGTGNPLRNGLADNNQSLEMALVILSQEVNKIEGTKKALSVLSRALEADPSSIPVWIIYLLLYYSTKFSNGELSKKSLIQEDDLFSYAVKHIEGSYELWLLYINSREQLNERFSAYERALSKMCYYASSDDGQRMHRSAAILDLCLQMLYCFCVSGNVAKAVQRIHRLARADGDSDESHSLLLSDILQCLTISDKCVLWVCCVYLVIYRKLPDSLVRQFEFEKDVSLIEWPSVHLTVEEKQHASKLMELALDSVGSHVDNDTLESTTLKPVHLLAVNHIKFTAAVEGVESCKILLEKYRASYVSCLDLSLLSARAQDSSVWSVYLQRCEETINSWPKDVPGIQCIWNQFVECALAKGRSDRAKEIMDRWFHCAGLPLWSHKRSVDGEIDTKSMLVDGQWGLNMSPNSSHCNNMDLVFGLLNLSLYKLLQNDILEAHLAIDKALKVAYADVLQHCVKEHAALLFNNGSHLMKDISVRGLIDTLKSYIIHARPISLLEPLTRNFIHDVRKPRTRQLVRNLLSPISPDSVLVNTVLEIWFGSSLLPPQLDQLKDLVDFVEDILEISPANYQLVISVCKYICKDSNSSNSRSASVLFWASSVLVNTMYHAIPFPPEHVWVEAAKLLGKLTSVQEICESFHHRALSVYPFSINLWNSFLKQSTNPSKKSSVVKAAREKGLELV